MSRRVGAGRVRAVLLGASGRVLADTVLTRGRAVAIPVGTRSVVVIGGPALPSEPGNWWISGGWAAGRPLPSASDGLLVAAGSVVDVRSLSRVGVSDLGVNAKRIRAFLAALRSRAGS